MLIDALSKKGGLLKDDIAARSTEVRPWQARATPQHLANAEGAVVGSDGGLGARIEPRVSGFLGRSGVGLGMVGG